MLRVYVVFDDCPAEFGDKEVIKVFLHRKDAYSFLGKEKRANPYEAQYYTVQQWMVE